MWRAECGMIWERSAEFNDKENNRLTRQAGRLENPRSAQVPSNSKIAPYSSPAMRTEEISDSWRVIGDSWLVF
jgi:hypothetical protein